MNELFNRHLLAVRPAQTRILWAVFVFCLLPFIIFSFFNGMSGDDYMLAIYYRQNGFFGTQRIIYGQWTGRFTSTFIGTVFIKFGWPQRYYFLHALLLFGCSWGAILFLLSSVNRYFLHRLFTRSALALAGAILLLVTIYVQAEVATGFYWFSSAVTYQTALILFLLLGGMLVRRFASSAIPSPATPSFPIPSSPIPSSPIPSSRSVSAFRPHWRDDAVISILAFLISGCNEIAAIFLAFFFAMLIVAAYYYRRAIPVSLFVYMAVCGITGGIVLLTSGVLSVRSGFMNHHTPIAAVLPMILFRSAAVFYYILKVPLFWIAGGLLYLIGRRVAVSFPLLPGQKFLVPGLIALPVLVLCTLTAILMVSKGALPDRALNNLVDLAAIGLLGLAFLAGISAATPSSYNPSSAPVIPSSAPVIPSSAPVIPSPVLVIILIAGMLASDSFPEAWRNDLSGYFYHSIQRDRLQKMEEAGQNHQKTVVLQPYNEALQEKIHRVFPHGTFATVRTLLEERPSFLFYLKDPDRIDPMPLYYYSLDSVTVKSPKM
ncbi:MAG TPA: hypothetical protein VGM30_08475 [Puia sp.]